MDLRSGKPKSGRPNKPSAAVDKQQLQLYPVLSIELMNVDELAIKLDNPGQLNRVVSDLMTRLESQLMAQDARIDGLKDRVLLFSFPHGKTPGEALSKAVKLSVALAQKEMSVAGQPLRLRVGMDIENFRTRGPMKAIPERLVAQVGQIVVSHAVYQMLSRKLPFHPIGPVRVQGTMQTFFRLVLSNKAAPKPAEAVKEPQPVVPEPVTASPTQPVAAETDPIDMEPPPIAAAPPSQERFQPPPNAATKPAPLMVGPLPEPESFTRKMDPLEAAKPVTFERPVYMTDLARAKSPTVSYEDAIGVMLNEIQQLIDTPEQEGKILALAGDQGHGKSYIVNIIRSQLPQEGLRWFGGGFNGFYGEGRFPLYYWYEFFQNLTGFPMEGIPQAQAREHLTQVLSAMFGAEVPPPVMDFFETLFSVKAPEPLSSDILANASGLVPFLTSVLSSMAQDVPLMLVMEDIQYADAASIQLLLELLQQNILKQRVIILLTYTRDVEATGDLQKALTLLPFKEFVLSPAGDATLAAIAEPPLAVPYAKLPPVLLDKLRHHASPLYLEECFRWLQLTGGFSINKKTGKFTPEKKMNKLVFPNTLEEMIWDRFNTLEPPAKFMLQMASILGERFSIGIVTELAQGPNLSEETLKEALQSLWQLGFLVPEGTAMARFRHEMVWQVIYRTLDDSTRQQLHGEVLNYLLHGRDSGVCVNPLVLANQAQRALNPTESARAWSQAGVWLANVGSITGANMAFNQLQNLATDHPELMGESDSTMLQQSLAQLNVEANPEYAKNLLLNALHTIPSDQRELRMQLMSVLQETYQKLGAFPQASSLLYQLMTDIEQQSPTLELDGLLLAMSCQQVSVLTMQGKLQEALWNWKTMVEPRQPLITNGTLPANPMVLNAYLGAMLAKARIHALQMAFDEAMATTDSVMAQATEASLPLFKLHATVVKGWILLLKGEYSDCHNLLDPLIAEIEAHPQGQSVMVWWGLVVLMYHCDMGDWHNASLLVPNTVYMAEQQKDYLAWTLCQTVTGRVAWGMGNYQEAERLLEGAVTSAAQFYLSYPALMGWRFVGENELAMGNIDVGLQVVQQALDVAKKPEIRNYYEMLALTLVHASMLMADDADTNKLKEAGKLLEAHWPWIVKTGCTRLLADAAFLIYQLYDKLSSQAPAPHNQRYQAQAKTFYDKAKDLWNQQGNAFRLSKMTPPTAAAAN